jgi:hypothetical protein
MSTCLIDYTTWLLVLTSSWTETQRVGYPRGYLKAGYAKATCKCSPNRRWPQCGRLRVSDVKMPVTRPRGM